MVEVEGGGQSRSRLDDPGGAVVVGSNGIFGQKLAADALMVALGVVVSGVFANKMSQVRFAKDDEVIEALMANRFDEALSVRVTVRALRWDGDAGDTAAGKEEFPLVREQRIPVVHQEPRPAQKSIFRIQNIAHDLQHPAAIPPALIQCAVRHPSGCIPHPRL